MAGEFNEDLCKQIQRDMNGKIDKLFETKDTHDRRLAQLEITFAKFETIPATLKDIHADLRTLTNMKPKVEDNAFWVGKVKWAVLWVSVIAIGGGIAAIAFKAVCSAFGIHF